MGKGNFAGCFLCGGEEKSINQLSRSHPPKNKFNIIIIITTTIAIIVNLKYKSIQVFIQYNI